MDGVLQGLPSATGSPYSSQLAPQGFFGSLLGGPVGGLIGSGIGGLFGNQGLGRQIGQAAGGIGGAFLPFNVDPMTAAAYAQQAQQAQYAQQPQQAQLAPQGWFGNLLGQVGQPLGGAIGGMFGNSQLGGGIGSAVGSLGRFLPFNVDPMTAAAYAQQAQYAQQPQQAQFAPQGWFGNLLGQVGQPLGGAIGGMFGNPQLGGGIGSAVGSLGRFLPFQAGPTGAYAQIN